METISKNKLLFIIILVLVLINIGTLSFVWYWKIKERPFPPPPIMMEPHNMPHPPGGKALLKEQLKLTDAQLEAVDKIRDIHLSEIRKIKEDMKGLKDKLFSNLHNAAADTNSIKDITTQIGNYEARIDMITFDNFKEVRKICNDEQKKKFDEIILDILKMGPPPEGRPDDRRGPPGMPGDGPPPPIRDGDGHRNPPNQTGPPEKK